MDVMVGPTFTIDVSSSPAEQPSAADRPIGLSSGDSSQSSSSIGTPDDSDDDNNDENDVVSSKRNQNDYEEEEVHNKLKGLASLDSLEDSLPIKRGLSNHFMGKSRSFTDLLQVNTLNTVKELQKQENPLNKRRRVQIASKWSRKSSFYTWSNPKSMPLLPVHEDDDYFEEEEPKKVSPSSSSSSSEEKKQEEDQVLVRPQRVPVSYAHHLRARFGSFKSWSLSDLKEHDEEEQDEDNDDE